MHATHASMPRTTGRPAVRPTPRPDPRPQPRGPRRAGDGVEGGRPDSVSVAPARIGAAHPATRSARTRRRRVAVVAAGAVVALSAVGIGFGVGHASAELEGPPPARPVYVVQSGDTLWTIAGRVAPRVDTARAVAALRDAAGGAALTPGQRIELPRSLS
jgi:nucleoid-associated protein YgaU